jgi:FKBP-type peptidyl-prolyl cis-trans isomerase 2
MDHEADHVKRIAELEAQLAERDAMTATAVKIAQRQAFGEASTMLLRLAAQRRRQTSLADAANIIAEMSDSSAPAEIDTRAVLAKLKQEGIEPTMTADEVLKLTRE